MKIASKLCLFLALATILFSASSCKKSDPCAVSGQASKNTGGSSFLLTWNNTSAPYSIQYRVTGSSTWTSVTSATDSLSLTGLTAGSNYEWQVKGACTSSYSGSSTFRTCDAGYEGTNCATESRTKYLGNWTESGTFNSASSGSGTIPAMTVLKSTSSVAVGDFISTFTFNSATYTMRATIGADGKSFTILAQTQPDGAVVTGTGSFPTATTVSESLVFTYSTEAVNVSLSGIKN